jgi:hypothetical protein
VRHLVVQLSGSAYEVPVSENRKKKLPHPQKTLKIMQFKNKITELGSVYLMYSL